MYVQEPTEAIEGPESLELNLQLFMSHYMDAGNPTWVLCKGNKHSGLWSHAPPPFSVFKFIHSYKSGGGVSLPSLES